MEVKCHQMCQMSLSSGSASVKRSMQESKHWDVLSRSKCSFPVARAVSDSRWEKKRLNALPAECQADFEMVFSFLPSLFGPRRSRLSGARVEGRRGDETIVCLPQLTSLAPAGFAFPASAPSFHSLNHTPIHTLISSFFFSVKPH